ncbi:MAG: phosphate acyltransferase [Candidatus Zixiibacteriota bacterium]
MSTIAERRPIITAEQIIESAQKLAGVSGKKMVAVAGASDSAVLGALCSASADGILTATLFGDKEKILKAAHEAKVDISNFDIVHDNDVNKSTCGAVKMAAEGSADVIMKGFVSTSSLLKTVLSKDFDLKISETVSHSAVLDIPGHHKLLQMTDGGMVVKPDIDQKIQIMQNAVLVARALNINPVRVALSAAVDRVHDDDPQSKECQAVLDRVASMNLKDILVAGPMTFDTATSKEVAEMKDIDNPVAGEADIYLVSTIEECNIIAKSLINFADTIFAGVIVGARVPVSLVSRTDTVINKKASVSVACLVAEYYKTRGGAA